MIYYIAMRDKLEKESTKRIIKEFDKTPKIYDAKKVFEEEEKILKKVNIIISDNDKDKIKKYNKLKKKLIVYTPKGKTREELLQNKNCYTYSKKNELREILCFANKRKSIWKTLVFSTFTIMMIGCFLSIGFIDMLSKQQEIRKEKEKQKIMELEKKKRIEEKIQKEKEEKSENVVFLGDSITEGYDLEKFYEVPSINSGVSGYCTDDIIKNLKDFVYIYNPTKVILLIGTNDIRFKDYGNKGIVNNIKIIIDEIRENRPYAKIYVESIFPINNKDDEKINHGMVADRKNSNIMEINEMIKDLCKEEKVDYIDLFKELQDEEGNLKLDYTRDGLHMSEEGYELITKKIKETVKIN